MLGTLWNWLVDFLFAFEVAASTLLVAVVSGWIAGWLAGRKATELMREDHIENLRPMVRVGFETRGGSLSCYSNLVDGSKPARFISRRAEWKCPEKGESGVFGQEDFPSNTRALASGGVPRFGITIRLPDGHDDCTYHNYLVWVRYEDFKGQRVWDQSHDDEIRVVETR